MIYSFKKGVANDFASFCENLVAPHAYFVPFSSKAVFREGSGLTQRNFSDRQKSLCGEWDFLFCPNGYYDATFDSDTCIDKIDVPCSPERLGYYLPAGDAGPDLSRLHAKIPDGKKSANSLYIYRKSFVINDLSKNCTIFFTNVRGRFEVYLNGVYCGFSALGQGEFCLSPYLVEGENELLVTVKRWSPCLFFDRGRPLSEIGILGDVYLTFKNANALIDYDLYCKEDEGIFNGKFTFYFSTDSSGARAEITLSHQGKEEFSFRADVTGGPLEYEFSKAFLPYTAETPNLYNLCIRVIEGGKVTEYVNAKVGFTSLDELGGTVSFCSRPLKIRAVEYNATLNKYGESLSVADYVRDFSLIKEYGFNAVKTTRPLDPVVMEAARDMGLYLIVDAGIDTDGAATYGLKKRDAVTDDKRFSKAFLEKISYLYAATRNNPAVLFYDFGEESATSFGLEKAVKYIVGKAQKSVFARDWAEIVSVFDPTVDGLVDEVNRVSAQKPVFMSSYARSVGLGSGYLVDFDEIIENTPCCLGGCVTRFCDESIDDVCVGDEGVFTADRKPYPAAELHKFLSRPVKARVVGEDRIELTNVSYFTDTKDLTFLLTVTKDGKVEQKNRLHLNLPPRTAREMDFFCGDRSGDKQLTVTVLDRDDRVVSVEQAVLNAHVQPFDVLVGRKVKVFEKGDVVEIVFDCGKVAFSKTSGTIVRYSVLGTDVLRPAAERKNGGCFDTKIDRPFIRNILTGDYDRTEVVCESFLYEAHENVVEIRSESKLLIDDKARFSVYDEYVVYAGGAIRVKSVLRPMKKCPTNIDCFAKGLRFGRAFDRVTYYGRGPGDNYVDLNVHAVYGVYETTAGKMAAETPFGQERGNRTDVHYAVLRNGDGLGLLLAAERAPYQLRVSVSSDEELAQGYLSRVNPKSSGVYVDVASMVSGYGSGVSNPMPKHRIKSVEHVLEFRLVPLKPAK